VGQQADGEQQDREAVREFQQSLPPDRQKVYVLLLVAAIVVALRYIISAIVVVLREFHAGGPHGLDPTRLLDTSGKIVGVLTANATALDDAVNAVLSGGIVNNGVLTLGVMLSTYVVLRPLMPAFRFKRMLFNLAPEPEGRHRSAVARWSVSQATGLYERERRVFAELGTRPPTEFPLDLAVSTLAMVLPLGYCGLWVQQAIVTPEFRTAQFVWVACPLVAVLVRLGWLWRTWRRRQLGRSGPYTPYELRIRAGRAIAKVEHPVGVRLLVLLLFSVFLAVVCYDMSRGPESFAPIIVIAGGIFYWLVAFMLIYLPWWYRIKRELRDLDRSYEADKTRGGLLKSLLIMTMGRLTSLVPFVGVFRVGRQIRRAQSRAGQPVTALSPWILTPGLLLGPVLLAYLQHELNKIWAVEAQPLDPWPAGPSRDADLSTGTLPWLKAPNGRTTEPSVAWRASTPAWNHLNGSADGADGDGELACREHLDPRSQLIRQSLLVRSQAELVPAGVALTPHSPANPSTPGG
jgi:hypothetical protein